MVRPYTAGEKEVLKQLAKREFKSVNGVSFTKRIQGLSIALGIKGISISEEQLRRHVNRLVREGELKEENLGKSGRGGVRVKRTDVERGELFEKLKTAMADPKNGFNMERVAKSVGMTPEGARVFAKTNRLSPKGFRLLHLWRTAQRSPEAFETACKSLGMGDQAIDSTIRRMQAAESFFAAELKGRKGATMEKVFHNWMEYEDRVRQHM